MSDDNSWVFDSLVCFLHGPVWNAPLQTFIEEKSLIFDPNEKQDPSNPEFVAIHNEYKNLVDFMLGSFMEEMQITPEQFEVACLEGRNQTGANNVLSFHQGLFQQIWAANDIRIFIRMMTQRNVELQLQALDLIERQQISLSDAELAEFNEQGGVELAADTTNDDLTIINGIDETEKGEEEIIKSVHTETLKKSEDEAEIKDKFQRLNLFFEKEHVNEEDVKSRQEYLRAQRDKILEIKKKARARQLNETVKKNGRPSSAQIAQKLMSGDVPTAPDAPPEASLQLRKMLAKRLRTEVVDSEE